MGAGMDVMRFLLNTEPEFWTVVHKAATDEGNLMTAQLLEAGWHVIQTQHHIAPERSLDDVWLPAFTQAISCRFVGERECCN
jgi:hypothetical protein